MVKTRTWIVILAAAAVLFAALSAWALLRPAAGKIANIYLDGELIKSVDLAAVDGAYSFTVESAGGVNIIEVEPGRIRVSNADCPDGVCVRHGWLSDSAEPIVCLPHRLVIRLEGATSGIDGEAG